MTHNINKSFDKFYNLSAKNRESNGAMSSEEAENNYFAHDAQTKESPQETALESYFEKLTALEESLKDDSKNQKPDNESKQSGKMDSTTRSALDNFASSTEGKKLTSDEIDELYLRHSRQINSNSSEAWSELDSTYSKALGNAKTPDTSMDSQSKSAIANFRSTINSSMTKDEMIETFTRFSREISVKYPQATNELQSILNDSIPNAYKTDTSMDANSQSAIANFKSAINAGMTKDEMNEMFLRFSRDVSVKYPAAWKELESTLSNYLPNAHKEDTTMDAQSRSAIANFKTSISENMTKDEMTETFLRFSRDVSVKYPDALKELESILNQNVPNAFKANTTSDVASETAVNDFKTSISESHTKDELIEMFLRYSRNISLKYPDMKNQLTSTLNNALPNAYKEDTTIDNSSKELVDNFKTIINSQDMDKDSFDNLFGDYFKQIGFNLTKAKGMMNEMRAPKFQESELKTQATKHQTQDSIKLDGLFKELVNNVDKLDFDITTASSDLQGTYDKDDQTYKKAEIDKMMARKSEHDVEYFDLMSQIGGNKTASNNIKDNYLFNMSAEKVAPDKKDRTDRDTAKLTEWDMLRTMKRDDLKGMMSDVPNEALADMLYNVPKYHLINGLTLLPHEQQIKALTTNRSEDALLREMPRKELIEQLPDAYEMLPVLMMMGETESGHKNGVELIKDSITKGFKVEEKENETKTRDELLPFIMEQSLNKSPRLADANAPSLGNLSPAKAMMHDFTNPNRITPDQTKHHAAKVEDLQPEGLKELAQEAMNKFNSDDETGATAAKRGSSKEMMQFLEDMNKVGSVDGGKMAMSNLYNSQAQSVKDEVLPALGRKELLKINKFYGRDPKEMVKALPTFVVQKQLHDLSKMQVVESYKKVGKDMIMDRVQTLPSQVLAKSASDVLNRDTIKDKFYNNNSLVA